MSAWLCDQQFCTAVFIDCCTEVYIFSCVVPFASTDSAGLCFCFRPECSRRVRKISLKILTENRLTFPLIDNSLCSRIFRWNKKVLKLAAFTLTKKIFPSFSYLTFLMTSDTYSRIKTYTRMILKCDILRTVSNHSS